jgi:hypothetical protein
VTETNLFVCTVGMELSPNGLPNDAIHVSSFSDEDGGIVKLNVMSQADTAFGHG